MTVTLQLQRPDGTLIAQFPAQDKQSIAQIAKDNGIEFPISCWIGSCWVCKCRILSWHQYVQIDKISMPLRSLERDDEWRFTEVFACIGWISSEAIRSPESYVVILEKNM